MIFKSKWMFAVSLLATCGVSYLPVFGQKQTPQNLPVVVTNGTGQPVPTAAQGTTTVAGTVNVGNTPNVNVANTPNVTISGTPTVSLAPGGSTNVTNPLDGQGNPTPLATVEAVQLYGSSCSISFNGGGGALCYFTAVPQGKQLVVQEFDAGGDVEAGNGPIALGLLNTITGSNYFPYTLTNNYFGFEYLATHQETRVYVLGGTTPACSVTLPGNSNGQYFCNISGFLVDVPVGSSPIVAPPAQNKFPALPFGRNSGAR